MFKTAESEDNQASFVLERQRGTFGNVNVSWNVTSGEDPPRDIRPTFGTVEFNEGEKFKIVKIFSMDDDVSSRA